MKNQINQKTTSFILNTKKQCGLMINILKKNYDNSIKRYFNQLRQSRKYINKHNIFLELDLIKHCSNSIIHNSKFSALSSSDSFFSNSSYILNITGFQGLKFQKTNSGFGILSKSNFKLININQVLSKKNNTMFFYKMNFLLPSASNDLISDYLNKKRIYVLKKTINFKINQILPEFKYSKSYFNNLLYSNNYIIMLIKLDKNK